MPREVIEVVIETPKRSRNKYAYDPEKRLFTLSRVLPAGMSFPFDFGFVPGTHAADGDPIDILVLMDEPAFPGCLVECRVIGVIEVEKENHLYAGARSLTDLPPQLIHEVGEFFVNYHRLQGREFRVLGTNDVAHAVKLLKEARRAA